MTYVEPVLNPIHHLKQNDFSQQRNHNIMYSFIRMFNDDLFETNVLTVLNTT